MIVFNHSSMQKTLLYKMLFSFSRIEVGIHIGGGVARKSKFPDAVPEIPVRDINEAAAYYESNLGFTVDRGGEEIGLAGISKGNCRMFLANTEHRKEYGNIGPVLTWLNLGLLTSKAMSSAISLASSSSPTSTTSASRRGHATRPLYTYH